VCALVKKIEINISNKFLGYCFGASPAAISRILLKWLERAQQGCPEENNVRLLFEKKVAIILDWNFC